MDRKQEIKNLSIEELGGYLASIGERPYRLKQLLAWLYQKDISEFRAMTNLSLELRERFAENFAIGKIQLLQRQVSESDHTRKFLFQMEDKNLVESVLIPNFERLTACLSAQVGCRFGCRFCASGRGGFIRDLKPAEMLNQLQCIIGDVTAERINNVVFMGMGEPLDNYVNLIRAIRIINHPHCFNIGARKITISSCGLPEGIKKLAQEHIQVELSVSLHAPDNKLRSSLMPVNRMHPLEELISVCRKYSQETKRIITFEYILIRDVNDRQIDAETLVKLLADLRCKVNLIIYNPFEGINFHPSPIERAVAFQKKLKSAGIITTLRQSKGTDIQAACGQLRLRRLKK